MFLTESWRSFTNLHVLEKILKSESESEICKVQPIKSSLEVSHLIT